MRQSGTDRHAFLLFEVRSDPATNRDRSRARADLCAAPEGRCGNRSKRRSAANSRLRGSSEQIHAINEAEGLDLEKDQVVDYLRFFVSFLQGDGGFFTLLDTKDVICSDSDDLTQTEQLELMAIRDRFRNRRAGLEKPDLDE